MLFQAWSALFQNVCLWLHVKGTDNNIHYNTDYCKRNKNIIYDISTFLLFHFVDIKNNCQNDDEKGLEYLPQRKQIIYVKYLVPQNLCGWTFSPVAK